MVDFNQILPPGVHSELEAIDQEVSSRRRQTLGQLLSALYGYGEILASGRKVHLDDFVGMLAARDALETVIGRASFPTRQIIEALVSESDGFARLQRDGPKWPHLVAG